MFSRSTLAVISVLIVACSIDLLDAGEEIREIYQACGTVTSKISGGRDVVEGHFPSLIQISTGKDSYCTGVALNPQLVLTAAHCLQDKHLHQIHVSPTHLGRTERDTYRPRRRYINRICIHPKYTKQSPGFWDVALLRLDAPLPGDVVSPDQALGTSAPGSSVLIVGHGTGPNDQVLSRAQCVGAIVNKCHRPHPSRLCVTPKDKAGMQKGDSGGPIFQEQNGKLVLVGIVGLKEANLEYEEDFLAFNFGDLDVADSVRHLADDCVSNTCLN